VPTGSGKSLTSGRIDLAFSRFLERSGARTSRARCDVQLSTTTLGGRQMFQCVRLAYSPENHGECAGPATRLGIVHVLSHSRHRQYVVTPMIVACVSTALPWQKGHIAGRVLPSADRVSGTVIASSASRIQSHEVDGGSKQFGQNRSGGCRDLAALRAPPVNGRAGHECREHVRRSAILARRQRHHARWVHFVHQPRRDGFMFERGNSAHCGPLLL
jgi:hypothetical protein